MLGIFGIHHLYAKHVRASLDAEYLLEFVKLDLQDGSVLHIGRSEVTIGQWNACAAEKACPQIDVPAGVSPRHPVTKVNWHDADRYVQWLHAKTGRRIRLPNKQEWIEFAANHKPAVKPKLFDDPRLAWAADYDITAGPRSKKTRIAGGFGENIHGIGDLTGNVWEWTATCWRGGLESQTDCRGARVAMGKHVAVLSDLVRDPGNGGCGGGIPPSNLGFRVVF